MLKNVDVTVAYSTHDLQKFYFHTNGEKKHKLQMNWRSQPSLYSTSYIWKIMISVLRNGGMCPPSTDATPFQLK